MKHAVYKLPSTKKGFGNTGLAGQLRCYIDGPQISRSNGFWCIFYIYETSLTKFSICFLDQVAAEYVSKITNTIINLLGVNFTNILLAAFLYEHFVQNFAYILGLNFFRQKNISAIALIKRW